ncbi:MAG: FG-GAP-like repeat-containing protein [Chryseolinea sp.]
MRAVLILYCCVGVIFIVLAFSCASPAEKDERTARQACGSCHAFPPASMLPKSTWSKEILPQMAFRMGLEFTELGKLSEADQEEVLLTLPAKAMVSNAEWEEIKRYYQTAAPDSLEVTSANITDTLDNFDVEPFKLPAFPLNTSITADTLNQKTFVGTRLNKLYALNGAFVADDSFQLPSPPSRVIITGEDELTMSLMGIMDPNDQALGKIVTLRLSDRRMTTLVDSLKRPVFFEQTDLDGDNLNDIIVCAFGNYSGNLVGFRNLGDGTYKRIVLLGVPGARKVVITDIDNNGKKDIIALMSQGDEKIIAFLNQGDFDFRVKTLLIFPAVYGSSYFDMMDFNSDGVLDILYTNGDNADYSTVLKPYHGVRIFLNNGKNDFNESWFYNMHGASQAIAEDFDKDGDIDVAAISFFPDFKKHPEQGFIYFENTGSGYKPQVTSMAADGRWLIIKAWDVDNDGDTDILLSALDFNNGTPEGLLAEWKRRPVSLLVLRNKLK